MSEECSLKPGDASIAMIKKTSRIVAPIRAVVLSPVALLVAVSLLAGCAVQGISEERGADAADAGWPMFNGGYSAERFSPLKQIDATNVASLSPPNTGLSAREYPALFHSLRNSGASGGRL